MIKSKGTLTGINILTVTPTVRNKLLLTTCFAVRFLEQNPKVVLFAETKSQYRC